MADAVQTEEVREAAGRIYLFSGSVRVKVINHGMECKHAVASLRVEAGHNHTGQVQTMNKERSSK